MDYLHPLSIAYYILFASFVVFINELFFTYNFSFLTAFTELFSFVKHIPKFYSISYFSHRLTFFKLEYFKLSSVKLLFIKLYSLILSYKNITADKKILIGYYNTSGNIYNNKYDSMGNSNNEGNKDNSDNSFSNNTDSSRPINRPLSEEEVNKVKNSKELVRQQQRESYNQRNSEKNAR